MGYLKRRQCFFPLPLLSHAGDGAMCLVYKSTDITSGLLKQSHLKCNSLDPLSATQQIVVFILHVKLPTGKNVLSLYFTDGNVGHCCYHCAGRN